MMLKPEFSFMTPWVTPITKLYMFQHHRQQFQQPEECEMTHCHCLVFLLHHCSAYEHLTSFDTSCAFMDASFPSVFNIYILLWVQALETEKVGHFCQQYWSDVISSLVYPYSRMLHAPTKPEDKGDLTFILLLSGMKRVKSSSFSPPFGSPFFSAITK